MGYRVGLCAFGEEKNTPRLVDCTFVVCFYMKHSTFDLLNVCLDNSHNKQLSYMEQYYPVGLGTGTVVFLWKVN